MPAWITSELRELVWVPIAFSASRMTTSRPDWASARAMASPTTPAPTTTASSFSTQQKPFEGECRGSGESGDGRHRARAAVERSAQQAADDGAGGEADGADQRGGRACRRGEGRKRQRGGVGHHQRSAEQEDEERRHDRAPMRYA